MYFHFHQCSNSMELKLCGACSTARSLPQCFLLTIISRRDSFLRSYRSLGDSKIHQLVRRVGPSKRKVLPATATLKIARIFPFLCFKGNIIENYSMIPATNSSGGLSQQKNENSCHSRFSLKSQIADHKNFVIRDL